MKGMRAQRRKSLLVAGGVFALIVITAIAAFLLFDINKFKSNIESAAFDATGLEVRIKGKMGLSFSPFGVSAKDIHVANKGGEIIALENLKLGLELMPLLKKQIEITGCDLVKPAITIVKDIDGRYNFESAEKKSTKWVLKVTTGLNELKLSNGVLVYLDKKTGKKTELKDFNLAIKDISTGNTSVDIIKSASFTGSVDCKEVLQKDLRIENLRASVKSVKGRYNFQPVAIRSLVYFDRKAGEKTELKEINLTIKDLSVADTSGKTIKNVSFTGNMDCKEVRKKNLRIENVKSSIKVEKAIFYLKPLTMVIFGAKGEGDATADKSKVDAVYKINLKVSKLDFEKLQKSFGAKKVIGGKGDLFASLMMKEKGSRNLLSSIDGTLSLRGDNLVTYTIDLDKVLSSYETSQEFNLVDFGAFFIAGPLGTVALRGYRYGDLYSQTQGGQGVITHFISHWKIKGGVADATDCAFATRHNRVALKGKLDLVSERYENVTVALLDDKGCAKFKQSISGPFDKPQISTVSAAESLAGPIFNLYRKAKRFFQGGKCEVFYNGAVRQPQ
jgi:AsmA protein